jgi:hypothetical protein
MILREGKNKKLFTIVLIAAILFKLSIFVFGAIRVPESIFDSDSETYLLTAKTISTRGAFGVQELNGKIKYEVFRTPGYPVFLAIFHYLMKMPLLAVILLQLFLTVIGGLIAYRIALEIDYRLGILAMAIALFDPPTSVYSLKIMTEALYLPLLSLFIYTTIAYFKRRGIGLLILSALILVLTVYIRPIGYFLGIGVAIFMIYANIFKNYKKTLLHAAIFLIIVHSLLGIWQLRNYRSFKTLSFTSIADSNFKIHGLVKKAEKNDNPVIQGINYLGEAGQDFVNLMTLSGSLKYYNSKPFAILGKLIFYPFMVFWLIGFLIGCVKIKQNIYYQFLLWIMMYYIAVTLINISDAAGERFRIPMVSCIAVVSAYGWSIIRDFWVRRRNV